MSTPSTGTCARSDSLRSALRAFAPRARTRPSPPAVADITRQPTPPQKDRAAVPPRREGTTHDDSFAPAESVRLVDASADGDGRRYVIERELTVMAELEAIVADYLEQAATWDVIPAAGPCCLLADACAREAVR